MPSLADLGRVGRVGFGIAVGFLALACGVLPATQGDPAAPVLVNGTVVDAEGGRVAGATILVEILDDANAPVGRESVVWRSTYTANLDGTFSIHFAPSSELEAFSMEKYSGFVNFHITAIAPDSSRSQPLRVTRELKAGGWADNVVDIGLTVLEAN